MYKILFSLIILSFILSSCEEDAKNVDLKDADPKLVVHAYLSPQDSVVTLILGWTKPVFGPNSNGDYKIENNASVKITEGNNVYPFVFNNKYDCYVADTAFHPIVGRQYNLSITTTDGENLTANCIIPNAPEVEITFISFDSVVHEYGTEYEINYNLINKTSNQNKKYIGIARQRKGYENQIGNDTSNLFYDDLMLYTIEPGKTQKITYFDYRSKDYGYFSYYTDSIIVYQLEEPCFKYLNFIYNNYGENPFAEPVIAYSNINNGLGVFSSMNKHKMVLPSKK